MIIKRSGEVKEFNPKKIETAITKAVIATKTNIPKETIEKATQQITTEIKTKFQEHYPNVENVQDIVEKHLMKNQLYEVSKAYILYRNRRTEQRTKEQQENKEKAKLGNLKIINENGQTEPFNIEKIKETITKASQEYKNDISINLILKELTKNIYDNITKKDIQKALILSAISFIEKDSSYSYLSGKLLLQQIYKEITNNSKQTEEEYKQSFIYSIQKGVQENQLDKKLLEYDLTKLSKELNPRRDNLLQYMGIQTLHERYFIRINNKPIELPQTFWMRVAMGLAINEEQKEERAIEFYNLMSQLKYVPSTPTLFHAGTKHPQLSSCYLNTVEDNLHHIFKVFGDNAQLSKWSGGIGTDWTNIRATGALIKSNQVSSQGVIPFLKIANDTTVAINRSGKRRGATCAYLETWHLDIEDFLDLKKNTGDERRRTHDMNTANWIPDLFMKRVLQDKEWTLFSPEETPELHNLYGKKFEKKYEEYETLAKQGKIKKYKTVQALKLWRKMLSMLFETGHPWITFKDTCNIRSPQDHCGTIHNSNLCTEITLNTSQEETAVCNLGSINLSNHIQSGKINEEELIHTIKTAIRMLDNVIDMNFYPTKEAKNSNLKHRPIGLGIMGFQDALYKLDIDFSSKEAINFADQNMELISYHAILASSKLAKEKGKYQSYNGSKWSKGIFPIDTIKILEEERGQETNTSKEERLDWAEVKNHVKQYGMRNSNIMAIAPTATISTISGCYPCIEPIYKNIYVKSNMSGEFTVTNSYLIKDLKKLGLWNETMLDQLKYYDGNLDMIAGIPDKLKTKYKEVFDIDTKHLIDITAARGKWIDQSQSFNIFIKGVSGKKLSEAYTYAWQKGLKTTYYLRSLAVSQIEKSTLGTNYGFTQKRKYDEPTQKNLEINKGIKSPTDITGKVCSILDPDCEACQ